MTDSLPTPLSLTPAFTPLSLPVPLSLPLSPLLSLTALFPNLLSLHVTESLSPPLHSAAPLLLPYLKSRLLGLKTHSVLYHTLTYSCNHTLINHPSTHTQSPTADITFTSITKHWDVCVYARVCFTVLRRSHGIQLEDFSEHAVTSSAAVAID